MTSLPAWAQSDTLQLLEGAIDEVVVTTGRQGRPQAAKGSMASIDEHLLQLHGVEAVKRGSYAWEHTVNNMQTERLSTTIDGMKIFSACTDRMDPVTSYVESGNLQRISLNSGLDGNPQATGNIGGSLNLKLRKAGFNAVRNWEGNASAGLESNGRLQVYGVDAAFSDNSFYSNLGLFYRHAGNYTSGGGMEVPYSQFTKFNAFANLGWQPASHHAIEATLICDVATDVGYPALNMDVREARGFISSLSYRRERMEGWFVRWESKLYYNHLTHEMDDTHRPDVVVHMDMPGRSSTVGLYSLLQGLNGRHEYQLNYDLYFNTLYADMTMYPDGQAPMFMLTWPDVATLNSGLAFSDDIRLDNSHRLRLSAKASWQHRRVRSDEGLAALTIYFPGMERSKREWQGRVSVGYTYEREQWRVTAAAGYGSRTPVVTEEYGYFLNNTFDRYDYIGNPRLKNESAVEANLSATWRSGSVSLKVEGNAFFFSNYIVGAPDERLSPMTLGAAGVKIYRNLSSARIVNLGLTADWHLNAHLTWHSTWTYAYGRESTGTRLPLIAPVTFTSSLTADWRKGSVEVGTRLAARHVGYSAKYGETPTAGYGVWHLNAQLPINLGYSTLHLRFGVENLFDHRYTTYSDWNHIPQKGRNLFVNASFSL